jgi:23S rRNA (uridine2552-2'-O)-methyltransferase
MAKNKFNKSWLHDHVNDPFVKLSQKDGFRSRAAYKLKEIDENVKLIESGQLIVDLGSTPGSWSQYVRNKLAKKGEGGINGAIIGLDMLPMEPIEGVDFILGDFREEPVLQQLETLVGGRKLDLVLSDMAPNLSGIALADAARMEHLAELALEFAKAHLKPNGALLIKCFNGPGYDEIIRKFREQFKSVSSKKPKASRDYSSEVYLLGKTLRDSE